MAGIDDLVAARNPGMSANVSDPSQVVDVMGLFRALMAKMNSGRSTAGAQPNPQYGMGMPERMPAPTPSTPIAPTSVGGVGGMSANVSGGGPLPTAPAPGLDFPSRPDTMVPLSSSPYNRNMATSHTPANTPLANGTSVPFPPQGQTLGPSAHPLTIGSPRELPYETYQRLVGKWEGGNSAGVQDMMSRFNIEGAPGSAEANLALQKALLASAMQGQNLQNPSE